MLAAAAAALGFLRVSALDVKTPEELFVENGTEARLPCTFSSREVISSLASISWSFQPEGATTSISFFYYSQGNAFPGKEAPFKNRISWAGDLNKKDASVTIANVQFRDNGTYFCDVKNPPDIVVKPGEIRLRVVQRDNLPAFPTGMVVAIAIGVTLVVLLLVAVIVCVVRKKNSKKHYSGYVLGSFQRGCLDNVLLQTMWLYLFWNLEWHRIK
ncbi:myelin protein zero-like protein 1 isoform X2 [Gopherus evgoodei]|uniref:myelin protein zero-like protein 1 isoform X2 n=1 Tax=Gopherus evgoodei TaxID=1825980 RepID=UPI0011CFB636|nr:myelin protein zero-like protein 1 isoform X2 [Gopherus evgoodei]